MWTTQPDDRDALHNRSMPRLIPSALPLWRSPTTVQLGVDGAVRITAVTPWQERVIEALRAGAPEGLLVALAADLGGSAADVRRFVDMLAPVLAPPALPTARFVVEFGAEVGETDRRVVRAVLRAAGGGEESAPEEDRRDPSRAVLLVAAHLVDPRRAAALVSAGTPHLGVELGGDRATVGPLVVPGVTPCHACRHAHRRDADPVWPVIASQLLARPSAPSDPALVTVAAGLAVALLSEPASVRTRSATLRSRDAEPRWHAHEPHPACWCRSPARSATPAVRTGPTREPTTAIASAQSA